VGVAVVNEQLKRFKDSTIGLLLDYAMKFTVVVGLPLATWFGQSVLANKQDIIHIKANCYTDKDASEDRLLERADTKEFIKLNIDPIHSSLAEIKAAVKENRNAIRDTMR